MEPWQEFIKHIKLLNYMVLKWNAKNQYTTQYTSPLHLQPANGLSLDNTTRDSVCGTDGLLTAKFGFQQALI
ncbi:hypothetical protein HVE01_13650 [Vreelandella venusta]|nr:hypothetical protein HVE01_13650 [Halomonas venusta]